MSTIPPSPSDLGASCEWVRMQFGYNDPQKWEAALTLADAALDEVENWQFSLEFQKASLLHLLGRKAEYRTWVDKLATWYPGDPCVLLEQATVAFEAGDFASALELLDRAMADPGDDQPDRVREGLSRKMICLAALGRIDEALRMADSALAAQPELAPYIQFERELIAEGRLDELLPTTTAETPAHPQELTATV